MAINPAADVIEKPGDIASEHFVDSFHNEVFHRFLQLDYAVNCAGVLGAKTVKAVEMETSEFDRLNGINYRGLWLSCRAQLRQMVQQEPLREQPQQRGSIVNIASQLGLLARPGAGRFGVYSCLMHEDQFCSPFAAAYCASKAAVINMTRANAIDYSEDMIRVNCVCPGIIETPMTTSSPEMAEALKPAINIAPMRRMGTPDEVANAVLFLCSAQASFIQGHALVVDGGYVIN